MVHAHGRLSWIHSRLGRNYLFLYLYQLGASNILFGAVVAVSQLAEIPYLWYSAPLQRLIGRHMSVLLSMLCFLACVIAYLFLQEPWFFLPFEFLKGLSFGALWSSAVAWVHARSSKRIRHYARRIFVFIYSGVGGVIGSVVGGVLYQTVEPRSLWLISVFLIVLAAISWAIINRSENSSASKVMQTISMYETKTWMIFWLAEN